MIRLELLWLRLVEQGRSRHKSLVRIFSLGVNSKRSDIASGQMPLVLLRAKLPKLARTITLFAHSFVHSLLENLHKLLQAKCNLFLCRGHQVRSLNSTHLSIH